jgi:hypothetical protein
MRLLAVILGCLLSVSAASQSRRNLVYGSFLKFPNSSFNVLMGMDHSIKLTRKDYTSGRFYFVLSPYALWSGYNFRQSGSDPASKFDNYQIGLPVHLRFELAPNRIMLGSKPGKHNYDGAVFIDVGLSVNYLLSANLREDFSGTDGNYSFVFNNSITSTASSRFSANYLTYNIGWRINRVAVFFRVYQQFQRTRYKDLSGEWGLPSTVHSFFYNKWPSNPNSNQGIVTLCLGYSF